MNFSKLVNLSNIFKKASLEWTGLGCDVCGFGTVEDEDLFDPTKPCPDCGSVMLQKLASTETKIETEFNKSDHVFGYQLLLDLYGCSKKDCNDLELCYDFLDKIVEHIGMNKMGPPQLMHGDAEKYPEKGPGISGWVPLIESSIVIHTLSNNNFISIDVYSCKYFEPQKALEFAQKYFKPKTVQYQTVERGIDYYNIETQNHSMKMRDGKTEIKKK